MLATTTHEDVKAYYGKALSSSDDLKTDAVCCANEAPPRYVLDVLPNISDEIINRFYGCGSPIPPALQGATVLDLGCGSGKDVYTLSQLVGEQGVVIGIDMTKEQLDIAQSYEDEHMKRFGYSKSNVIFKQGYIEDLAALGIPDESIDLVVSNCVINLSPFKDRVFSEIYRVLKPGGELYFSDVFADRRIPKHLQDDPVVRGECLGGALYSEDFRRLLRKVGWEYFVEVTSDELEVHDFALETRLGFIKFASKTIRAIKADGLEDTKEDYGQQATYLGGMPELPRYFDFDNDLRFVKNKTQPVDGNTAKMIEQSRYGKYFSITPAKRHRGVFNYNKAKSALDVRNKKDVVDLDFLHKTCEKEGIESFEDRVGEPVLLKTREALQTMQVNITYKCNLACRHCYLECSPVTKKFMTKETMEKCLQGFEAQNFKTLDITGGSPEYHPNFEWFVREGAKVSDELIVRTNLTLLHKPEYRHLIDLFVDTKTHLVGSLPFYDPVSTDAQRGKGVFENAIRSIKLLNERGYGVEDGLPLDIVYNVSGPFLPPPQELVEDAYKDVLRETQGVEFNELLAFNNFALGRFAHDLLDANMFEDYLHLLHDNFNALAVTRMMCRDQVNVDVDGKLYDCECNHVLDMPILIDDKPATVDDLISDQSFPIRDIKTHPVCYSCSAGAGSSCGGSLV